MQRALIVVIIILVAFLAMGGATLFLIVANSWMGGMMYGWGHAMDDRRLAFLEQRDAMVSEMIHDGEYACCLVKPCIYCIEKTPGHGEGASCHCLDDVMNGQHPCGECIGEILEGHGNHLLAPYFGTAISEEVGLGHLEELQKIIEEKYGIPIGDQFAPAE